MNKGTHPIVAQLRSVRRSRDILQRDLEARTGYQRERLSQWEQGHRVPNLTHLTDWANALGYDVVLQPRQEES